MADEKPSERIQRELNEWLQKRWEDAGGTGTVRMMVDTPAFSSTPEEKSGEEYARVLTFPRATEDWDTVKPITWHEVGTTVGALRDEQATKTTRVSLAAMLRDYDTHAHPDPAWRDNVAAAVAIAVRGLLEAIAPAQRAKGSIRLTPDAVAVDLYTDPAHGLAPKS